MQLLEQKCFIQYLQLAPRNSLHRKNILNVYMQLKNSTILFQMPCKQGREASWTTIYIQMKKTRRELVSQSPHLISSVCYI